MRPTFALIHFCKNLGKVGEISESGCQVYSRIQTCDMLLVQIHCTGWEIHCPHFQEAFLCHLISERELKFMFAICHQPSVCLSVVCRLSVTLVHPTQAIEIFGNVFTSFGILAIHDLSVKILRRSSQGNPSVGGVKHKRGSRI